MAPDTIAAYQSGNVQSALTLAVRDVKACQAANPPRDECVTVLRFLVYIARDMKAWVPGEAFARKAVELSDKYVDPNDDDRARTYTALAEVIAPQKKFTEAEAMLRKALDVREHVLGRDHEDGALSALNLANHLVAVGKLGMAAPYFHQAYLTRRKVLPQGDAGIVFAAMGEADSLFQLGQLREAEALSRDLIPFALKNADAAKAGTKGYSVKEAQVTAAAAIAGLANNLAGQGRLEKAEREARRGLALRIAAVGDKDPYTAFSYLQVAHLLDVQGKFEPAETMAREGVRIASAFLGRNRFEVLQLRSQLASILADRGKRDEARALYDQSLQALRRTYGDNHPEVVKAAADLASLDLDDGNLPAALTGYRAALASKSAIYGATSPRLGETEVMIGSIASRMGDKAASRQALESALVRLRGSVPASDRSLIAAQALLGIGDLDDPATIKTGRDLLRSAVAGTLARNGLVSSQGPSVGQIQRYRTLFEGQLRAEWLAGGANDKPGRAAAFAAAQWAMSNDAAAVLAKVSASYAREGSAVGKLEAQRADLQRQRDSAEDRYIALFTDPDRKDARDAAAATRDQLDGQIAALGTAITAADPAFAELARPTLLTEQAVAALLRPGEAVLLTYTARDATYAFLVTSKGSSWRQVSGLGAQAASQTVDRLRERIIGDLVHGTDSFDAEAANGLYNELLAPFEPQLAGIKSLITVANDPLVALPFALLVSRPQRAGEAAPEYLIDRYAITSLPALSSLRALRCLLVARSQVPAGCGGWRSTRQPAPPVKMDFAGIGAPALDDPNAQKDGNAPADFGKAADGTLANTDFLRSLGSLAGAEVELGSVARAFAVDRRLVRTGPDATEAAVKTSPAVAQSRFLLFSTHGLLASESGIRGEPGLVFTPPAEAAKSVADDGLLTASEASKLKLSADFVVLSACNTATSKGENTSDGLSSLVRSFFFAGARALLVSHWYISDESTVKLMTGLFDRQTRQPGNRAEAVRAAMLAVRADPRWHNPAFWAPFSLIGSPD